MLMEEIDELNSENVTQHRL